MLCFLRKHILKLELLATQKYESVISKLEDPDIFNTTVSNNFLFIRSYNRFIRSSNLFIEYYPREKINGEWQLRPITLACMSTSNNIL